MRKLSYQGTMYKKLIIIGQSIAFNTVLASTDQQSIRPRGPKMSSVKQFK